MRNILWVAALAASLGIPVAKAEDLTAQLALSAKDAKYNSPACRSILEKARNYDDSVFNQSPETYIFAAVAPGGSVGLLALQHRKRELFKAKVEQTCMTNPPDRSYLDPSGSPKD